MSSTPFRFRDLPSEIRNKVYGELLCSFGPRPTTADLGNMFKLASARHTIDTAILRTNKTTYLEAYDVMIKKNRFVKITSIQGLKLQLLLCGLQVPVVTSNKRIVDSFRGYVLEINLRCGKPLFATDDSLGVMGPCNLMVLHRDMDVFCEALADGDAHSPGYREDLQISMTVAPILNEPQFLESKPPMREFFSETTQQILLAPFRAHLRGYKAVKIQGYVHKALTKAAQGDIKQDRCLSHEQVLADFTAAKQNGATLFQQRKADDGCLIWQDAAVDIDSMLESSAWSTIAKRGGERYVSRLAELYFLVRLNIAHGKLSNMLSTPEKKFDGLIAGDALNSATRSLRQDHWAKGYKYRPADQHLAKLRYRFALFIRLQGEEGTEDRALRHIESALRL